jgi:hypothetical protein
MEERETQVHNPKSDTWVKRDRRTGQFIGAQKRPYKGLQKERQKTK